MNKINLSTLKVNMPVDGYLALQQVQVATASNNKQYLNMTVTDGELSINCKKWDHSGEAPAASTVMRVVGSVGEYQGIKQIVAQRLYPLTELDDISIDDFVKQTPYNVDELWETAMTLIKLIQDEELQQFVHHVFYTYSDKIRRAPAAVYHHQAYLGGLLEHSVHTAKAALNNADEQTNIPLLIAGALLHDIGKVLAYKVDGLNIAMTDEGKLLEHMVLGCQILSVEAQYIKIAYSKVILLQHIIASHHGKLEWGSPVVPHCKEALLIHLADMVNSNNARINQMYESNPEFQAWTPYNKTYGCEFLVPQNGNYALEHYEKTESTMEV
jgi:3'-5' exoribonuclease